MKKTHHMTYDASLTNFSAVNPAFDSAVLRIAYYGDNRNNSSISKDVFENAVPTMYNCPIVTNYDREEDSLGGHDVGVYKSEDGAISIINLTTPIGVIPESAKYWWETVEHSDGSEHEYLSVEVLLWKRQEAYKKIKAEGIVKHSMEISINEYELVDNIFVIKDFSFTAFALIGENPCFEESSLTVTNFNLKQDDFKEQMTEMLNDFKLQFSTNIDTKAKGGGETVSKKIEQEDVANKESQVNEDFTAEELDKDQAVEETVEFDDQSQDDSDGNDETQGAPEKTEESQEVDEGKYALNSSIEQQLLVQARTLYKIDDDMPDCDSYEREYAYSLVDFDAELSEAYFAKHKTREYFGFKYAMNGDTLELDLQSKFKVKFAIVPYLENKAEEKSFSTEEEHIESGSITADEMKFEAPKDEDDKILQELEELRAYKIQREKEDFEANVQAVFESFSMLDGEEEFDLLKESYDGMTVEEVQNACYVLVGKKQLGQGVFSSKENSPRIIVMKENKPSDDPYGGIFARHGFN